MPETKEVKQQQPTVEELDAMMEEMYQDAVQQMKAFHQKRLDEVRDLVQGKTTIINRTLREDILFDKLFAKVVRLTPLQNAIYSGKARLATHREKMAMQS